jgi:hypothetical protein
MERLLNWISTIELNGIHIVSIVIFFIYIFGSILLFAITFATGRGYLDLAKGLHRILVRQEANGQLEDIEELSAEISKYYDSYCKLNPTVNQRHAGIISWMDEILLQTNMFSGSNRGKKKKLGIWFDEYYDTLILVRAYYERNNPFYRCTSSQSQILEDVRSLGTEENADQVNSLLKKTEAEFLRLNQEGKKNERSNYISIAIGVAGILVSVLLTVLQMFG